MKKITFIVSVLEDNKYLKDCVESIISQKEIEKEIILISTSKSCSLGNLIDIKKYDKYITKIVESEDNPIIGKLRNEAVKYATGDYIWFVSGDDFFENDSVCKAVEDGETNSSDIIVARSFLYNTKTMARDFKNNVESLKGKSLINPDEASNDVFEDIYLYNKLFKKDFIVKNNILFSETFYYDYVIFVIKAMTTAKLISTIPIGIYVERLKIGLDKIKNPCLEEKIDVRQLYDVVFIVNSLDKEKDEPLLYEIVGNKALNFIVNRGLNYVNVEENKFMVLSQVSRILNKIDFNNKKLKNKQIEQLNLVKNEKFNEYFEFLEKERVDSQKRRNKKVYFNNKMFKDLYKSLSTLPIKKRKVVFFSHTPGMDGNFEYIEKALDDYNNTVDAKDRFTFERVSTKSSLIERAMIPKKIANAEFIILCENIPVFQELEIRKETKVIQSWHAAGAFKKFGYSTSYMDGGPNPFMNKKMTLHRGYTHATVSSADVVKHYADAFRMDESKVIPVGVPRVDFFFDENKVKETKNKIYGLYPEIVDKKVILYAPTFRGFGNRRKNFTMEFDINKIARNISDDYVVMLKLHPSVQSSDIKIDEDLKGKVVDATSYKEANDILTVTDLLITDYSSIIFDYSILGKPMIFYAYDLEEYIFDRDFYYEYEDFVPGPIVRTNDEIIKVINENKYDLDLVNEFCKRFFVANDGNNAKRFVDMMVSID